HYRRRALGRGDEGLVRDDQGRQGALSRQSALGRRVGLGALQVRRARHPDRDELQEGLSRLPHPGQADGLGLRQGLSGPRRTVSGVAGTAGERSRRGVMHKYLFASIAGTALISTGAWLRTTPAIAAGGRHASAVHEAAGAADDQGPPVVFEADGKVRVPTGFRKWVFVGSPLTPNGLNHGEAGFPEFHNVYVEQKNVEVYLKTGSFPEGTVIVKELTRVLAPTYPDGSRDEPSGRGYFNGAYNGIDMTVKDSTRFSKTNGWGFFTFGHHPLPYDKVAAEAPVQQCAGCHAANVAKTDMTWVQFYPLLRDKQGY